MGKARGKKAQPRESILPPKTTPPSAPFRWAQSWTVLLLLYLMVFLIYFNTFSASFHLDDSQSIVDNPWIKNLSNLSFSETRYVGYLSFALNYQFGQLHLFGYHLANLLIHITNGFLVYFFVLLLLRIPPPHLTPHSSRLTNASGIALATALLFVAHPIQTQAVTYIVQRFTSLATLFYLLAVVLYLKWRLASEESRSRSLYYAGALLSTVLAMKTKEISFTLPFMLLLVEAVFFGSLTRKQWIALVPFLLTLAIIPLSRAGEIGEGQEFAKETTVINRLDYLLTQFRVIMTYLRLLILPVHQNLDYDYPISHSLLEPKVLFSFLFLLVLFTFSLYLLFVRPRAADSSRFTIPASRLVAFGILWFFLTLSIESSIIPIRDVIFEHRLYLPSVGLLLAGSVLILTLLDRWRGISVAVIGALVVILCVATYQRNLVWKDDLTLWTDVVQKSPHKARGHYNLGNVYQDLERFEEAIQEYKMALGLKSDSPDVHINLGNDKDLGRQLDYIDALNNLGLVYLKQGKLPEALAEFDEAVKLKPDYIKAHNNLGLVYMKQGRLSEALTEFDEAVKLKPDYTRAHYNLGTVYQDQGRFEEAIREFQIALKLKPDLVEAHYNLGQSYQRLGRIQEATHEFEQALQIQPDYDLARRALKSLGQ